MTKTSILFPHHRSSGAECSASEPPLVLAFGEVPDEYAAARTEVVLFDECDRDCVRVDGPDAAAFLHRLFSNPVKNLGVGEGNRNLLLSSKGKVLFDFDLAADERGFELSLAPGVGAAFQKALDTYHFGEKLTLADHSAKHAPLAVCGPKAAALLARVFALEAPAEDHRRVHARWRDGDVTITALPVAGSFGWRVDAGAERALELWKELVAAGAKPVGRIVRDILRVEALWAEPGVDIDENVYPQEARLERGFSLEKGCYIGQEVVAKIDTYGGLNKRLVALAVSHDDPIPHGTRLWRNDEGEWRDLGVVTSWAYSFALDKGLVLAYVKRRHQKLGTSFRLGSPEATLGDATIVRMPVRDDALAPTGEFE